MSRERTEEDIRHVAAGEIVAEEDIRAAEGPEDGSKRIYEIPLREIHVGKEINVRRTGALKDLEELADSIEELGLLHPVMLLGEYGQRPYKLIVGQRRFLAHKRILAKRGPRWKKIRAVFVGQLSDVDAKIRSLAENVHRVELNHADAAEAVTELYRRLGKDVHAVASATGLSVTRVNRYLKIQERASTTAMKMLRDKKVRDYDVKRALDVAEVVDQSADRILEVMSRLTPTERGRLVDYGRENPGATVEKMEQEARKPRIQLRIWVDLTAPVRQGLEKASKAMEMKPEEIAALALEDWLKNRGFIA